MTSALYMGGVKRTGGGGGTNGKDPKIYMQRASIRLVYQIEEEKQKKDA